MNLETLQRRYVDKFGSEPAESGAIRQIEFKLQLRLPDDFRAISAFYSGGVIGGVPHNAIAPYGPATNITEETLRLRTAIDLPHRMIVIAELSESIVIMNTDPRFDEPAVMWCDSTDARLLRDISSLHNPRMWKTYQEFFGYLLDEDDARTE